MILASLADCNKLNAVNPHFAKAFEFLRREETAALEPGRYEIDGENVFAMVQDAVGRGREKSPLEAHRKYIDIQYIVSGTEEMGWKHTDNCTLDGRGWNDEKDLGFYEEKAASWFEVEAGFFAVFFPEDAHAPMAGTTTARKIVVKVAAS